MEEVTFIYSAYQNGYEISTNMIVHRYEKYLIREAIKFSTEQGRQGVPSRFADFDKGILTKVYIRL